MSDSGNRTDHKRRRRQADRALEIHFYEENFISLAHLSQLQNEDHVLDDVVIASDADSPNGSEGYVVFPGDDQCDDIVIKNKISCSSPNDIGQESAMQDLCESEFYNDMNISDHLYIEANNEAETREDDSSVIENNVQNPQEDNLRDNELVDHGSSRNESNCDNSDNSNCDSSDSEQCSEECPTRLPHSDEFSAVIEKPYKLESFTLSVTDVSPEVWKIIKGEEEEKTPEEILKAKLASWSSKYKVKRNAVDELLHTLRDHGHPELPACSKTLLKTPRSTQGMVKSLAGGHMWYRGIQTALMKWLITPAYNSIIVIDIFIDGLVSDCNIHGDPEEFSCFKYENHLGQLKSLLLAPGRDLQQLICRLIERSLLPVTPSVEPSNERFYLPYANRPTLDCQGKQLEAFECVGSVIRVSGDKVRDSFVQLSSLQIVVVENIVDCGSSTFIIGRQFLRKSDYFKFPIPSSCLHIYEVSQLGPLEKWNVQEIKQKIVYYPINVETEYNVHNWKEGDGLCLPLLHSEA